MVAVVGILLLSQTVADKCTVKSVKVKVSVTQSCPTLCGPHWTAVGHEKEMEKITRMMVEVSPRTTALQQAYEETRQG